MEAVFSVLQSASLRSSAPVTVIRASQKKLLVALLSYQGGLENQGIQVVPI